MGHGAAGVHLVEDVPLVTIDNWGQPTACVYMPFTIPRVAHHPDRGCFCTSTIVNGGGKADLFELFCEVVAESGPLIFASGQNFDLDGLAIVMPNSVDQFGTHGGHFFFDDRPSCLKVVSIFQFELTSLFYDTGIVYEGAVQECVLGNSQAAVYLLGNIIAVNEHICGFPNSPAAERIQAAVVKLGTHWIEGNLGIRTEHLEEIQVRVINYRVKGGDIRG